MNIILIIIGILGIIYSIFMTFACSLQLSKRISYGRKNANSMITGIWQFNVMPMLSTIFLFIFRHWIFTIPIFLSIFPFVLMLKLGNQNGDIYQKFDGFWGELWWFCSKVQAFIGGIVVIVGPAVIFTLRLTGQKSEVSTVLSWYLPIIIISVSILAYISYILIGMLIVKIALFIVRKNINI